MMVLLMRVKIHEWKLNFPSVWSESVRKERRHVCASNSTTIPQYHNTCNTKYQTLIRNTITNCQYQPRKKGEKIHDTILWIITMPRANTDSKYHIHKYWPQIQHISSKYHSYQNLSCKKEEKKFFHIDHITIVTELCTWRPILLLFAMSMAYS